MSIMNLYLKWSPIIPENQVNRSMFCVASSHLSKTGEGVLYKHSYVELHKSRREGVVAREHDNHETLIKKSFFHSLVCIERC